MATITRGTLAGLTSRGDRPYYVYDSEIFMENIANLTDAFARRYPNFRLAYSFKTNYLEEICMTARKSDMYAEVVSPQEYEYARSLCYEPEQIIYNGVVRDDMAKAFHAMSGCKVNVDSVRELKDLDEIFKQLTEEHGARADEKKIEIGLRVNVNTGNGVVSRFGMDQAGFDLAMDFLVGSKYMTIGGVHCHVGSGRPVKYWATKTEKVGRMLHGMDLKYVDLGGGMYGPMEYKLASQFPDYCDDFDEYAEAICNSLMEYCNPGKTELILEPGTALAGNAMRYVCHVTDIKEIRGDQFVTTDGASNHMGVVCEMKKLPYDVLHTGKKEEQVEIKGGKICGCTCLEYDYLEEDVHGRFAVGDTIVFRNVGAYSYSSSRQFIIPRPEVVDPNNGTVYSRKTMTVGDWKPFLGDNQKIEEQECTK